MSEEIRRAQIMAENKDRIYLDEFRLNGSRVYSFVVKERLNLFSDLHVVTKTDTVDVSGGDDPVACQLPHVELMHLSDTFNLFTALD